MSKIKDLHMKYRSPITYHLKDMTNVKGLKCISNFKVNVIRSIIKLLLVTRNTHMKYESPVTYHSKYVANVEGLKT
jgi:hypothetical protein